MSDDTHRIEYETPGGEAIAVEAPSAQEAIRLWDLFNDEPDTRRSEEDLVQQIEERLAREMSRTLGR